MTQEEHGPGPVSIVVNTRSYTWEAKEISFEQVVGLAYPDSGGSPDTFTVQYSRGPDGHGTGSLTAGHSVHVKNGMVFDVFRTAQS